MGVKLALAAAAVAGEGGRYRRRWAARLSLARLGLCCVCVCFVCCVRVLRVLHVLHVLRVLRVLRALCVLRVLRVLRVLHASVVVRVLRVRLWLCVCCVRARLRVCVRARAECAYNACVRACAMVARAWQWRLRGRWRCCEGGGPAALLRGRRGGCEGGDREGGVASGRSAAVACECGNRGCNGGSCDDCGCD